MGDTRKADISGRKPECMRQSGRPRNTDENNIKTDFKNMV
jgi:hypothetical protein